jgi:hypothetical protein
LITVLKFQAVNQIAHRVLKHKRRVDAIESRQPPYALAA